MITDKMRIVCALRFGIRESLQRDSISTEMLCVSHRLLISTIPTTRRHSEFQFFFQASLNQ